MYAFAHNSQTLSAPNVSPQESFINDLEYLYLSIKIFNRNKNNTCISQNCSQLPEHSHYEKTDLNPFFYKTLSKPIPPWFVAIETAMLQIYSMVHAYAIKKIVLKPIKQNPIMKLNPFHLVHSY